MSAASKVSAKKKISIALDPDALEALQFICEKSGRGISNVAGIILRAGMPDLVEEIRREQGPLASIASMVSFARYVKVWRDWRKGDLATVSAAGKVIPFAARRAGID